MRVRVRVRVRARVRVRLRVCRRTAIEVARDHRRRGDVVVGERLGVTEELRAVLEVGTRPGRSRLLRLRLRLRLWLRVRLRPRLRLRRLEATPSSMLGTRKRQ